MMMMSHILRTIEWIWLFIGFKMYICLCGGQRVLNSKCADLSCCVTALFKKMWNSYLTSSKTIFEMFITVHRERSKRVICVLSWWV